MRARRVFSSCLVAGLLGLASPAALAQSGAAPPPGAVETAPLPPPGGTAPPPPVTLTQPAPGAPAVAQPAGRPTLIAEAGDPSNVDDVALPEKPVLIMPGSSSWDDGLKTLRSAFARIEAELARLGIAPAGRPLAIFLETSDETFRYEAMVPIPAAPEPAPAVPAGMRFGTTPSGKAYRFVHKGPYEDVDSTYETITTYLDAKDILARDVFIEEYVNDVDPADPDLEVNIFVQPR